MKIKIFSHPRFVAQGQFHPIFRAKNELYDLGYEFVEENYDLAFLNVTLVGDFDNIIRLEKDIKAPIVILDDAASSGTHKFWTLKRVGSVKGYIKKQLLRDRNLYKTKYPRNRYHYYLLSSLGDHMDSFTEPAQYVDDEVLSKIKLGWNSSLSERHGLNISKIPNIEKPRDIDIHFSVKTKYTTKVEIVNLGKVDDHYAFHRVQCQKLVEEIARKHNFTLSGKCKKAIYLERMSRSKVCVSPWGLGELCWRDWESITNGAILIKPNVDYIETWPDVFIPWKTYVPVKYDWSDLEDALTETIKNYDKYKDIPSNGFEIMGNAWDNEVFANKFHEIMKSVLV